VELTDAYEGIPGDAIRGVVVLSDGEANEGAGLSDLIRVQNRQEREVRVGAVGGQQIKDYVGGGLASSTKHPLHIFSVGVGDADWEVLRIFAEASGGVVVRASASGQDLGPVLERFSKYF
jgi:hypothetical protein